MGRSSRKSNGVRVHRQDLARGEQFVVDRRVEVAGQPQVLLEDGTGAVPREVEVGVMHHVDDRRLRGHDFHRDVERPPSKGVGRGDLASSREAHLSGSAAGAERDAGLDWLGRPHAPIPPLSTAVEVVVTLVAVDAVVLALQAEPASRDPIAVTADGGAEVVGRRLVCSCVVEAEDDVTDVAVAIGNPQGHQPGAVVGQPQGDAGTTVDDERVGLPSVRPSERTHRDHRVRRRSRCLERGGSTPRSTATRG